MAHNDILKTRDVDPVLESGTRPRIFVEPEFGPEARYGITTSRYISIMCSKRRTNESKTYPQSATSRPLVDEI
jgi:hypothetical protein